ncbi:MAG: hypothetical protein HC936_04430 [Leptolyngbyaceae cyanobacterium SU_3_3]|nr:hypothetical protein [Leptolyngbyaceae cyanobacterium SU_3_3]
MADQPLMPNPSVDQRLWCNLQRARLEIDELGLQLDKVLAKFDEEIRQQKLKCIQKSLSLVNKPPFSY